MCCTCYYLTAYFCLSWVFQVALNTLFKLAGLHELSRCCLSHATLVAALLDASGHSK